MKKHRVGWIGLGKMGLPMARQIATAGYPLAVYNRSPEKAAPLVKDGAHYVDGIQELASGCDILFSMIADDRAFIDIAVAEGAGALHALPPGSVFVDMSTISPVASERAAALATRREVRYLRAPVSGSTAAAAVGGLTILASGPQAAYREVEPLFDLLGKKRYYLGAEEQARYVKLSINMMVGITAVMMGEAMVLSERAGVDWSQFIEVVNNSAVASPLIGYKSKMLSERDFTAMFSNVQMTKDFDLALDAARSVNVPMPVTALARQMYGAMVASGRGEADFFSYVTLLEELAGLSGRK